MTVAELGAVLRWQGGGTGIVDVGDYDPPWFFSVVRRYFLELSFQTNPKMTIPITLKQKTENLVLASLYEESSVGCSVFS